MAIISVTRGSVDEFEPEGVRVDEFEIGEVFEADLCPSGSIGGPCIWLRASGCLVQLKNEPNAEPCHCVWFDDPQMVEDDDGEMVPWDGDSTENIRLYNVRRLDAELVVR